ncbi:MAG: hypothetical protein IJ457_09770 [Clostridia bacterium]|nr:hypothetical protein [Clostridia bacterium]
MKIRESSLLKKITALFDGAEEKLCPVLTTDSLLLPSTTVRVLSAERDCSSGTSRVIFELKHRYRDIDPSDGIEAFSYLEYLCGIAEATQQSEVLSLEGGGSAADGSVAECCARLVYIGDRALSLTTSLGELTECISSVTFKEISDIRTRRYIYGADPVRDRVGGEIAVRLVCTREGASKVRRIFSGRRTETVLAFGGFAIRTSFVLSEFYVGDEAYAELLSSGTVEYGDINGNGDFVPFEEGGNI